MKKVLIFLKHNMLMLEFLLLSFCCAFLIRVSTVNNVFEFRALLFDFSTILVIGSLGYYFSEKKRWYYYLFFLVLISLICTINSVYYMFYNSFVSVSMLSVAKQSLDVSSAVTDKISIVNFVYIIPLIIFIVSKNRMPNGDVLRKKSFYLFLATGIVLEILNVFLLSSIDKSRLAKQWNREYIVERCGIITYQINDIYQTSITKINSTFGRSVAAEEFINYFDDNSVEKSSNEYTNMYKDYNVVVIHMESFMDFLLGLNINGKEVTPNLNKLVSESMFFSNFYAQTSSGTSSDSEFTFNTSLLPSSYGTVAVSYYNREYISLPKLLRNNGYYAFSMHGNKDSMWNRKYFHQTLGYIDFYSQSSYDMNEIIGLGLSDHSFFEQSENKIIEINDMVKKSDNYKNWFGTLITLSNHTPFDGVYKLSDGKEFDIMFHTGEFDEYGNEIVYNSFSDNGMDVLSKYIKSAAYADQCLGEFIDYVNEHDEFNNTLFVFYGDHAAQIDKGDFRNFYNYDFSTGKVRGENDPNYVRYDYNEHEVSKRVPLIFWSKDGRLSGNIDYPMGMIDVLPTLGNMIGIYDKYALGHDIFEIKNDNIVVFPNGNFLTNAVFYNSTDSNYYVTNNNVVLDADYIDERIDYSENVIKISNDIIIYNLIRYTDE